MISVCHMWQVDNKQGVTVPWQGRPEVAWGHATCIAGWGLLGLPWIICSLQGVLVFILIHFDFTSGWCYSFGFQIRTGSVAPAPSAPSRRRKAKRCDWKMGCWGWVFVVGVAFNFPISWCFESLLESLCKIPYRFDACRTGKLPTFQPWMAEQIQLNAFKLWPSFLLVGFLTAHWHKDVNRHMITLM